VPDLDPSSDLTQKAPRLCVEARLSFGADIALDKDQSNYLINVMRLGDQDRVKLFNGKDGEWLARLAGGSKKSARLILEAQIRPQTQSPDLIYLFAPLKHARQDYMMQKATEMGASQLVPVMTRRTQVSRVNLERMRANTIEAAEQCEILSLPAISEPIRLDQVLSTWPQDRLMIFCDEDTPVKNPIYSLQQAKSLGLTKWAVLIGPEGGFEESERRLIKALPHVITLSLGPRILRADTAAIAALAIVQACLGDWQN